MYKRSTPRSVSIESDESPKQSKPSASSSQYERRQADMEEAEVKYLGLKKGARKEVVERAHQELQAARLFAEEARFEVVGTPLPAPLSREGCCES